jgi:hypothetical protein
MLAALLAALLAGGCTGATAQPTEVGPLAAVQTAAAGASNAPAVGVTASGLDAVTPQVSGPTGGIAGRLSYPSESIPPLHIVAFEVGTAARYTVSTQTNQEVFELSGLPPGTYHVVAYAAEGGLAAGYSQAVACGLSVDCTDHSLVDILVTPGEVFLGADPGDWYAPEGTFPPMPVP